MSFPTIDSMKDRPTNGRSRSFALRLATTVALTALVCGMVAGTDSALAQSATRSFSIPAQPLASALNAFGRQSGLQVTLAADTSRGVTSTSVSGNLTPEEALARMLSGTNITYRIVNGTVVVGAQQGSDATTGSSDGTVLAPIVIEGQRVGQGGVGETVIGPQELARVNPTDLDDVFRQEPGIQVGSSLPMSQKVYVHGVEETNLAVTIDGARQNNKVFHHNATNLIDPSILKAVDVDAGIAPADAGPGALAGSINYETKDAADLLEPGKLLGGFITTTYDFNSDTVTTGIAGYGQKDGFEFLGYFSFAKGNNFENGDGKVVLGTETDMLAGIGKVAYEADSGDRFEFSYDQTTDDALRPYRANAGTIVRPAWEPRYRNYKIDRKNYVFTYTDTTPEGMWDPTLMLAYGGTVVDTPVYAASGYQYNAVGETTTFNGKFENKFAFDIGNVIAGVDFYSDKADLQASRDSSREKARNVGFYTQARLEPWERTRISLGGRADYQWFTGTGGQTFENGGFSGNISGEYDLTDFLTAKAGFSHVWAGIPLAENFIMNPAWRYGANGPDPTTANNYMIGLEAHHEGFTAEASLFRTDMFNVRDPSYSPVATGALISRDVESRGYELGAGYEWTSGYVKVKYAHIDVDIDGIPADSDSGNYIATPVGDVITITAAHTFDDWNLTVGGDIAILPKYYHVPTGTPPYKAYEVVNLFADWKPEAMPALSFRAEVKNLFNETYADRATYGQEFGTVTPLYEPGRTFMLTAKATF